MPGLGWTLDVERKLATVPFVDVVDSTSLVTSADPEVVRRRVSQHFASGRIASNGTAARSRFDEWLSSESS